MTGFCKIKHHPNPNQTKAAVVKDRAIKINTITIDPNKKRWPVQSKKPVIPCISK
jgi:hypothetical protein